MEANLVIEGLKFMVLGMTTVFLFLMLMIFVLNIISKIIGKYFILKKISPAFAKRNTPIPKTNDDNAVVAAIAASIQEFKKQK
ncbi:MAG: OadG family protein [Campylobacteraceae bacterium]|nr:OadG family protein [Campylobacteraceae bacterium]